jgi:phosphatidate cytidylyltransferase
LPELPLRIASALVLAFVAIGATILSPWTFLALVILASAAIAWEWGRLVRDTGFDPAALAQMISVAAAAILVALGRMDLALLVFVIAVGIVAALGRPKSRAVWSAIGVVYVALPVASLLWLRWDAGLGATAILFVLGVAWTTDTVSYAAGRLLGGPKLAPGVSPKKTWSGFIIGTLAPALIGYAFAAAIGDTSPWALGAVAVLLALACQLGDLFESAVKRQFGTKDMSQLIPGHGGLLDRLDGFLFAAVVAAAIALRDPGPPAAGLLIW